MILHETPLLLLTLLTLLPTIQTARYKSFPSSRIYIAPPVYQTPTTSSASVTTTIIVSGIPTSVSSGGR
ncbi:hypothetical protein HDV00_004108, partial [Rhizophlyctis rosea]